MEKIHLYMLTLEDVFKVLLYEAETLFFWFMEAFPIRGADWPWNQGLLND